MNFDLSPDQRQFDESVERALGDIVNLAALTAGGEAAQAMRDSADRVLGEMGVSMVLASEAAGGLGLGLLTLAVASDRLGEVAAPTSILNGAVAAWLIAELGHEGLREAWLERLLAGQARAAFAVCEGPAAWLPASLERRTTDAEVEKLYVADAQSADLIVAILADSLVFLEASEVSVAPMAESDLDMTRPTSRVSFAPKAGTAVGGELTERLYDALLILAAADAVGAGRAAFTMAVSYAKTREQFGQPIGSFQGLKHQLADMAVDIEPARFLCWYAAHLWDTGAPHSPRFAALAKAHAGDVAVKTARAAVEAHGGIGYTWEYPLHLLLKRVMHDRAVLGSSFDLRARAADLPGER